MKYIFLLAAVRAASQVNDYPGWVDNVLRKEVAEIEKRHKEAKQQQVSRPPEPEDIGSLDQYTNWLSLDFLNDYHKYTKENCDHVMEVKPASEQSYDCQEAEDDFVANKLDMSTSQFKRIIKQFTSLSEHEQTRLTRLSMVTDKTEEIETGVKKFNTSQKKYCRDKGVSWGFYNSYPPFDLAACEKKYMWESALDMKISRNRLEVLTRAQPIQAVSARDKKKLDEMIEGLREKQSKLWVWSVPKSYDPTRTIITQLEHLLFEGHMRSYRKPEYTGWYEYQAVEKEYVVLTCISRDTRWRDVVTFVSSVWKKMTTPSETLIQWCIDIVNWNTVAVRRDEITDAFATGPDKNLIKIRQDAVDIRKIGYNQACLSFSLMISFLDADIRAFEMWSHIPAAPCLYKATPNRHVDLDSSVTVDLNEDDRYYCSLSGQEFAYFPFVSESDNLQRCNIIMEYLNLAGNEKLRAYVFPPIKQQPVISKSDTSGFHQIMRPLLGPVSTLLGLDSKPGEKVIKPIVKPEPVVAKKSSVSDPMDAMPEMDLVDADQVVEQSGNCYAGSLGSGVNVKICQDSFVIASPNCPALKAKMNVGENIEMYTKQLWNRLHGMNLPCLSNHVQTQSEKTLKPQSPSAVALPTTEQDVLSCRFSIFDDVIADVPMDVMHSGNADEYCEYIYKIAFLLKVFKKNRQLV